MAETVAELYYQLGLDTTNLNKGFIDAEKTVNQNMRLLNRQEALIKLRADVQIQGLDENIEYTDALKIRQESLAKQLDITKERVELTNAAYEQMKQAHGENAEASQFLAISLEKERLKMMQLERQTRELNEQQQTAIGVQWELLGLIEPAMKGIQGLYTNAARLGPTFATLLGRIPEIHAKIAAAALMVGTSVAVGTKQATDELEEENLAKLLESEFTTAQNNISNSLDVINQETLKTSKNMNQAFQYQAQREVTNEDYLSDFLRIISVATEDSDSLSDALGKVTQNAQYMNTELGKTIALAIGVAKVFSALQESAKQWVAPALEGFQELKKQAQEMKVPIPVASDIINAINLAGGDYEDVRDYVRGVQDAIIKGDVEDPESLALAKYGVVLQDARGNLLPFNEALENLYQGFLKAKEAGEEEAYVIMTNGQSVHDVLPFLENFADAKKKINSIEWSTSDYASLDELSTNMKMAEIQTQEFETALSSLAIPFANYSAESDFDFYKTLTKIINENRDTVLYWEFTFIEALKSIEEFAGEKAASIADSISGIAESLTEAAGEIGESIGAFGETFNHPKRIINFLSEYFGDSTENPESSIFEKAQKDLEEYTAANEKAREETKKTEKEITDGLSYSYNRIRGYKEELADIKIELEFGDDEYGKELAKLDAWKEKVLQSAKYYEAEQDAIQQLYWAKREQAVAKHLDEIERIETEKAQRLAEIRRNVNSQFSTDLQNQLNQIDLDKNSWVGDGMEEAEAEMLAQKLKAKAIIDLNKEVAASLDSIWDNELERRLAGIEREKQAWIQKGVDEVQATQWAEQAKANARKELEDSFSQRVLEVTGTELEIRLGQIETEKQAWIQKGIDEVRATELAEKQKAQAIQAERDKLKSEYESALQAEQNAAKNVKSAEQALNDALEQREELRKRIAEKQAQEITQAEKGLQVLKSQLEAFRAYRDKGEKGLRDYYLKQLRKQGITDKDLKMTPQQLEGFQKAQRDAQKSLMQNLEQVAPPDPELLKQLSKLDDRIESLQGSLEKARQELEEATEKRKEAEKAYKNQAPTESTTKKDDTPPNPIAVKTNPDGSISASTYDPSRKSAEELDRIKRDNNKFWYGTENPNIALKTTPTGAVFQKALDDAGNSAEDFKKKLDDVDPSNLQEPETPSIPVDFSDIAEKFEDLSSIVENINSGLDDLTPKIDDTATAFDNLAEAISQIENPPQIESPDFTEALGDLTSQFAEIVSAIQEGTSSIQNTIVENSQPPNITNNISIQEAHAWDYDHIEYLAEKVADIIEPKILSAVGGNPNGY